jgi:hypothetical protein
MGTSLSDFGLSNTIIIDFLVNFRYLRENFLGRDYYAAVSCAERYGLDTIYGRA